MHRASGDTKEILPVSFCESSIALGDVRRDGCGCPIELISEEEKSLYCSGSTKKQYRNPVSVAEEWLKRMEKKNLTQVDLARELGVSRARVTQVMNILKLPENVLNEYKALGDPMEKQLITERKLRNKS